jgi:hypothetical protein
MVKYRIPVPRRKRLSRAPPVVNTHSEPVETHALPGWRIGLSGCDA